MGGLGLEVHGKEENKDTVVCVCTPACVFLSLSLTHTNVCQFNLKMPIVCSFFFFLITS